MRTSHKIDPTEWPEIWQAAYQILEQSFISHHLRTWVQPLQLVSTQPSAGEQGGLEIVFGAVNDFSAQWVRDKYLVAIREAFAQVTGQPCSISIVSLEGAATTVGAESPRSSALDPVTLEVDAQRAQAALNPYPTVSVNLSDRDRGTVLNTGSRPGSETLLDPRYTFDSFVVGASNQFAHASAVAVAEQPGRQYNPLFIYSQPGLGKTHLLHAIGNHIQNKNPSARVGYFSSERFVNELIDSLQHKRMAQFRAKFREGYDLVMIDDIQFIAGKETTEDEFFHTFNALYASKRQIVVTSDRPPKDIAGLEERIRTRFEWGLVSDITPPEIETRIAILKAKAERDDIYLPDELATFLANHIKSNVRQLEGILVRLQAEASLTGANISLEMAKHHLRIVAHEEGSQFTVENIQAAVARHFRLKPQDFKSNSRAQTVALPRQIAMYLIRKYTHMGFKEIGQYFGGKDHTTILHAFKKIESRLESDTTISQAVEAIQNML